MEDRSSRRMRTLVTHLAVRGLSANQIACALISMMARSTKRSNQRPDTLMQDRMPPDRRTLLRRTAGPYIRVRFSPHDAQRQTAGLPPGAERLAAMLSTRGAYAHALFQTGRYVALVVAAAKVAH
jgi:hypothetical protein